MNLFYHEERNQDFFNACEQIRKQAGKQYISVPDIARQAVYKEASSFYIQEKEFAKILHRIKKGKNKLVKSAAKSEQYKEIERRYKTIQEQYPEYSVAKIVRIMANQKAPRFYLTESTAVQLYYKLLRNKQFRSCGTLSYPSL